MLTEILQDALFSAIAAIGFASVSHPPMRAYPYCAVIAAVGHLSRFILMSNIAAMHIIPATLISSFIIGILAVCISPMTKIPAETYLFPSLLPMVPGIYSYRAFGAFVLCLFSDAQESFIHNYFLFAHNAMTCVCIILCMTIGATTPIFILKKISFQATR